MGLPKEIADLIERFERNRESYMSGAYNETQLRREFLDPFFSALGWDVENKQGYAEAYKDVIHEDALKIGGATKAPDYCFRIGSVKKFFVEAKKPSVNLKDDISPAFQLRRYAWSAKLPLSILTDFGEFAVYDCRIKPVQTDKASTGRLLYFTYKDYPTKWDEIVSIYSREAVLKGSFDKYAESSKLKKGTTTVDDAFLTEIEDWRDLLARNIAIRNPDLSQRELNFAVQRTIDRIVFLRICEDRGIEEYGRLQTQLNGTNVYKRLVQLFSQADDRYNSGLFHFQREKDRHEEPDKLTPNISIDDKPLKDIINRLYYPESPYEFSVLSADILGQVYEQFLGKVIRLTAGHQAKVEEKPEVRKAGGVYYTPKYIVDYIVKNTVGKLLDPGNHPSSVIPAPASIMQGQAPAGIQAKELDPRLHGDDKIKSITPKEAVKIRILDPACGSGSFLLGAYQYLLDWHLKWYIDNEPDKWAKVKQPTIYQGPSPDPRTPNWHLTTAERKRILLNNIYGVDIDSQAVEVTKLSLLLKVLEGENNQTLANQLRMFHERALPDLGDNIKCGNSLISPDFYQQQTMLEDEDRYRVNVFDWEREFSEIMKVGGFDVVIGNPPYGADYSESEKHYFQLRYIYKKGKPETYIFFIEKGVSLLRTSGILGYITPNAWLTNHYGVQVRSYLLDQVSFNHVVDLEPVKVFEGAVVDTMILVLSKGVPKQDSPMTCVWVGAKDKSIIKKFVTNQKAWKDDSEAIINLQANPIELNVLQRIDKAEATLDSIVEFSQGVIPYETKAEGAANKYISSKSNGPEWLPLYENASQVRRYSLDKPKSFIKYGDWLTRSREQRFFSEPKILFHRLRKKLPRQLIGCIETSGAVNRHSLSNLILRPNVDRTMLLAVLGLFNSNLANWLFVKKYGVLMEVGGFKIGKLPLPIKWDDTASDLCRIVEQMLSLNRKAFVAKTDHEKTTLQRQIDGVDQQIDQLVYELYDLTEEEIRIVEGDRVLSQ
ncbi:MAG: N-6 DNA methylase [Nitrospirae bacterium]|nr:N-6 DNA methylase [Nitrospirota bacterium]